MAAFCKPGGPGGLLQPRIDPGALVVVGDVHELGTDGAGVDVFQLREEVAQLHALATAGEGARVEFGVEVGVGQSVEGEAEVGRVDVRNGQAERIELGGDVAARAVGREQAEHTGLFLGVGVVGGAGSGRGGRGAALLLCRLDAGDGAGMGDITGLAALEGFEIPVPFGRDGAGIGQPGFVDLLYVIGVAAGELGGFGKLADQVCAHVTTGTHEKDGLPRGMWGAPAA